jgi:hypothetical protein
VRPEAGGELAGNSKARKSSIRLDREKRIGVTPESVERFQFESATDVAWPPKPDQQPTARRLGPLRAGLVGILSRGLTASVKTGSLTVAALQRNESTEPRASSTPGDDRKSCTGEHRLEGYRTGGA